MVRPVRVAVLALSLCLLITPTASAGWQVTYSGSQGNLSASADFLYNDITKVLTVTLKNTSTSSPIVPTDVLTGVFFSLAGDPALNKGTATLANGSKVYSQDNSNQWVDVTVNNNVGGEFGYRNAVTLPSGSQPGSGLTGLQGISSSGLGLFGDNELFGGPNLSGPTAPDGLQYGIISAANYLTNQGNGGVNGTPLISNAVVFTFTNVNLAPNNPYLGPNALGSSVYFQYGTALNETRVKSNDDNTVTVYGDPEPATLVLVGLGAVGAIGLRCLRRKSAGRVTEALPA